MTHCMLTFGSFAMLSHEDSLEGESFEPRVAVASNPTVLEMKRSERVGFEPTEPFPAHTLSKRAPSTTRTPLPGEVHIL